MLNATFIYEIGINTFRNETLLNTLVLVLECIEYLDQFQIATSGLFTNYLTKYWSHFYFFLLIS